MNFLRGCVAARAGDKGIFEPYDEAVMYPFVEVIVPTVGTVLSMGNKSAREHEAHVKSMQFGVSNGLGVKIEIVDEAGGRFYNFFSNLGIGNKDLVDRKKTIRFKFGYITQDTDGVVRSKPDLFGILPNPNNVTYVSQEHELFILNIECQANGAGCFKFIISGEDLTIPLRTSIDNRTIGKDTKRVPITIAIQKALEPYGIGVDFIEIDDSGGRRPLRFQKIAGSCSGAIVTGIFGAVPLSGVGSPEFENQQEELGPCGIWPMANRSPMVAVWDWIRTVSTPDRKSISFFWEDAASAPAIVSKGGAPGKSGMRLVFCKTNKDPKAPFNQSRVLGTYIVNGGRSSPVVSFQPTFKYTAQHAIANANRPAATEFGKSVRAITGPIGDLPLNIMTNLLNTGFNNVQQSIQPNGWLWYLADAAQKVRDAMLTHNYGNPSPAALPIEAELKIQGNPAYDFPILMIPYVLSIVYINPYRPKQSLANPDLVDWSHPPKGGFLGGLFSEVCNPIISNCNWMIRGITHDIRDGTYHTTIKLYLASPGIDLPPDSPLGGCPNTPGFTFK